METHDTTGDLAKLAGLPLRNVTYWTDSGVLRPAPGTNRKGHGRNRQFPISERKWMLLATEFYRSGMLLGEMVETIDALRAAYEPVSAQGREEGRDWVMYHAPDTEELAAVYAYTSQHHDVMAAQRSYWNGAVSGAADITGKPILYVLTFWGKPSSTDLGFGVRTMGVDLNDGPTFDTTTLRALVERHTRIVTYNLTSIFTPLHKEQE